MTTRTATTMMAARAPFDRLKASFCDPEAPASLGSGGLSSPPLYPADIGSGFDSCASTRRGKRTLKRRALLMMARYNVQLRRGRRDGTWIDRQDSLVVRGSCEAREINSWSVRKRIPTTRYRQRNAISIFAATARPFTQANTPRAFVPEAHVGAKHDCAWATTQVGCRQRSSRHSLNIEGLASQMCVLERQHDRIGRGVDGVGA